MEKSYPISCNPPKEDPPKESTNLSTEIYKTKNDLGPESMKDTFLFKQKP